MANALWVCDFRKANVLAGDQKKKKKKQQYKQIKRLCQSTLRDPIVTKLS